MKPKDIFGLAVRILGLVILYHLILAVPAIIPLLVRGGILQIGIVLVGIAVALGVIWWLIGGASFLMERAYPANKKDESTASSFGKQADA